MVTRQLQVERRTGEVRRPKTDVLPLCHANLPPGGCRRTNQINRLGHLGYKSVYRLLSSTTIIVVYYYYSPRKLILILPAHGRQVWNKYEANSKKYNLTLTARGCAYIQLLNCSRTGRFPFSFKRTQPVHRHLIAPQPQPDNSTVSSVPLVRRRH